MITHHLDDEWRQQRMDTAKRRQGTEIFARVRELRTADPTLTLPEAVAIFDRETKVEQFQARGGTP